MKTSKRILSLLLSFALLCGIFAALAIAPASATVVTSKNLLVNPGAETGTLKGWKDSSAEKCWIVATKNSEFQAARSGKYYFCTGYPTHTATNRFLYQNVSIASYRGQTLTFSGYLGGWGDKDLGALRLDLRDKDYKIISYKATKWNWQKQGDWTKKLSVSLTIPANACYATAYMIGRRYAGSCADVYFDDLSLIASKTVAEKPATPKITKFENVNSGTKITWNAVSGAAKYLVFVKNGTAWKGLATVTSTSYINTAVKSATKYTYTVRAVDSTGKVYSDYNKTGWSYTFIPAPVLVGIETITGGLEMEWKLISGVKRYRIFRKTDNGAWKALIDTADPTHCLVRDKSVVKGHTYAYTVRCLNADGTKFISGYNTKGISFKY